MHTIIQQVRQDLVSAIDRKTLETSQYFFKEPIQTYGVKTAAVRAMAKLYFQQLKGQPKEVIFDLCEELWQSGFREESVIASYWSFALRKQFTPDDFTVFERWIKLYVNNWASCDDFCNQTIGTFLLRYPSFMAELSQWAGDENRWVRRAAAVSLIVPARKGKFVNEILDIASLLLQDKDDLVQKGYGWMLKVTSQMHQQAVFDFIMERKHLMPRTALRYAIEKMPEALKAKAMER